MPLQHFSPHPCKSPQMQKDYQLHSSSGGLQKGSGQLKSEVITSTDTVPISVKETVIDSLNGHVAHYSPSHAHSQSKQTVLSNHRRVHVPSVLSRGSYEEAMLHGQGRMSTQQLAPHERVHNLALNNQQQSLVQSRESASDGHTNLVPIVGTREDGSVSLFDAKKLISSLQTSQEAETLQAKQQTNPSVMSMEQVARGLAYTNEFNHPEMSTNNYYLHANSRALEAKIHHARARSSLEAHRTGHFQFNKSSIEFENSPETAPQPQEFAATMQDSKRRVPRDKIRRNKNFSRFKSSLDYKLLNASRSNRLSSYCHPRNNQAQVPVIATGTVNQDSIATNMDKAAII